MHRHLAGGEAVREGLAALTRRAQYEVLRFAPHGWHASESIDADRPIDEELLSRGVRLRASYLDSICHSPHAAEYAQWLASRGGTVRTVPSLPVRMVILDQSCAVVETREQGASVAAVVLRSRSALTALCTLFESVWSTASALCVRTTPCANGLSFQERATLELLSHGLTDAAIAKRLDVSERTARRMAAGLMERLGARSRFQAGVLAAQHGWFEPAPLASVSDQRRWSSTG